MIDRPCGYHSNSFLAFLWKSNSSSELDDSKRRLYYQKGAYVSGAIDYLWIVWIDRTVSIKHSTCVLKKGPSVRRICWIYRYCIIFDFALLLCVILLSYNHRWMWFVTFRSILSIYRIMDCSPRIVFQQQSSDEWAVSHADADHIPGLSCKKGEKWIFLLCPKALP